MNIPDYEPSKARDDDDSPYVLAKHFFNDYSGYYEGKGVNGVEMDKEPAYETIFPKTLPRDGAGDLLEERAPLTAQDAMGEGLYSIENDETGRQSILEGLGIWDTSGGGSGHNFELDRTLVGEYYPLLESMDAVVPAKPNSAEPTGLSPTRKRNAVGF